jgi:hypothetical protein
MALLGFSRGVHPTLHDDSFGDARRPFLRYIFQYRRCQPISREASFSVRVVAKHRSPLDRITFVAAYLASWMP